jgi:hypothetical protein
VFPADPPHAQQAGCRFHPSGSDNHVRHDHPSATDAFIAQQLPVWLRSASVDQLQALRARFLAHRATQDRLAEAWRQIESPTEFARPLFERMLSRGLGIEQPLEVLRWEEVFQRFQRDTSPFLPEFPCQAAR